jgi:lipopolysaccharide transport system permease protein
MTAEVYTDAQQREILRVVPELIRYRYLLLDLVWKEIRARYRNAMMGLFWAVLQPLLMTVILTFVFTMFLGMSGRGALAGQRPFAVVFLCAFIPWQFFSLALTLATASLIMDANLVKKVHFPREAIPLASVGNVMVNLVIGFLLLIVVLAWFRQPVGLGLAWTPLILAVQIVLVVGLALFFSCLNVFYRDVAFMLDAVLTFGFYASPVIYPLDFVTKRFPAGSFWYKAYMLNPMAGLLSSYREAILENRLPGLELMGWPICAAAIALAAGVIVFRRFSPYFADHL